MDVKKVFRNKKVIAGSVALLVVAGVAIGGKVYADNQQAKKQAEIVQLKKSEKKKAVKLGEDINSLFVVKVFTDGKLEENLVKDAVVVYGLKMETVQTMRSRYYQEKSKDQLHKSINQLIVTAENQVKDIDSAKVLVAKVYKDKVINKEQKNYDAAKKAVEKVKNAQEKKELTDKLEKVKAEIDKDSKAKKNENKDASKSKGTGNNSTSSEGTQEISKDSVNNAVNQNEVTNAAEPTPQTNQEAQQPVQGDAGQGNYYEPQTPVDNGGGYTPPASGGNSGGAQTPTPTPEPNPAPTPEPEQPTGPPAGWIVPPYPIGSGDLMDWLADNGYSGYDSSDGYIRPY